jgi:putative hydrolase of the HAD superfamily
MAPIVKHLGTTILRTPHRLGWMSDMNRRVLDDDEGSLKAVLFDFGGVLSSSPFEAFEAYEASHGLPHGFIRSLNATDHHENAWARLERSEISIEQFVALFEAEAESAGQSLDGMEVLSLLGGQIRPRMVAAVERCRERYLVGLLTNNFLSAKAAEQPGSQLASVLGLFDAVVESSRIGVRKPEVRFFEIACERLAIAPHEAVFLDDLGVNLKPARSLGMRTIKVTTEEEALAELSGIVGIDLS